MLPASSAVRMRQEKTPELWRRRFDDTWALNVLKRLLADLSSPIDGTAMLNAAAVADGSSTGNGSSRAGVAPATEALELVRGSTSVMDLDATPAPPLPNSEHPSKMQVFCEAPFATLDDASFQKLHTARCFCERIEFDVATAPLRTVRCGCALCGALGFPRTMSVFAKAAVRFSGASRDWIKVYCVATDTVSLCTFHSTRILLTV